MKATSIGGDVLELISKTQATMSELIELHRALNSGEVK